MDGYLLDTNMVSFWFDETKLQHPWVVRRIASLPEATPLFLSVIALGEIEYGRRVQKGDQNSEIEAGFEAFIERSLPAKLDVRRHTRVAYGSLRAELFDRFAPKGKRTKGMRPEQLTDPSTSLELGIQENDLWIAAQAIEHNLVLISNDKMSRIQEVAEGLRVENWAKQA